MRNTYIAFLVMVIAWMTLAQIKPKASWTQQCTTEGAIVQETFQNDGFYCTSWPGDAQWICDNQAETICQSACYSCGARPYSAFNCMWENYPFPYPNSGAVQYGCTQSSPWPQKYYIECSCLLYSCLPPGTFCTDNTQCCTSYCDAGYCSPSPILLDLAGNSHNLHLTSAGDGVRFDINATGQRVQVAWTRAGSDMAFVVLDRNGNGSVDDGAELFGSATPLTGGSTAANGFIALTDLDVTSGGPVDGRIDSRDPAYDSLRLWLDRNHNGVSEFGELLTLDEAGVTAIFTHYRESRRTDLNGNRYAFVGSALVNRNGREHRRVVFDVLLRVAR